MALNPNISLAVKGIELQDPLAQYGKFAAIQNAQQQNQLAQMQMQKSEREQENLNRLGMLDPASPGYINEVTRINPQLGSELSLRRQQQTTAERQAASAESENRGKNLSYWQSSARDASRFPTDDVLKTLAQQGVALGLTDEATAGSRLQQLLALPLEKRAEILRETGAPAYVPKEATPRASQLRTPEEEAQALRIAIGSRPPVQPREPSAPVLIFDETTGRDVYVSRENAIGKPAGNTKGSAASVSEQQSSYNIARVLNAANEIGAIVKKDPSALAPGAMEAAAMSSGLEGAANVARSTNRQIVSGAQRDALDALLYLATGAAYNKEQLQGAFEAYIPSYTDDKGTREAKQTRMTSLIQDAKVRAGKAWTPKMDAAMNSLVYSGRSSGTVGAALPSAAVEYLKANPNTKAQFDAKYGAGAADRALGAP